MSKSEIVLPLAEGFAPAADADWRALVEKTLKGAAAESLVSRIEGVEVAPLYTASDATDAPPMIRPPRQADRAFDLRTPVLARNAGAAHDAILEALEGGAASVLIDTTVLADGPSRLSDILDGVLTDVAPIALSAGEEGAEAAERLSAAVKASPAAPLAFHMDPIGSRLDSGEISQAEVTGWAETAARLLGLHPRASLFLADGTGAHERGAAPALELAFALASAVSYAKALVAAGLSMEDAFKGIVLALAVDQKPLIGISKLRAARLLWARVTEACDAPTPVSIEARSSHRMLTTADPWSNLIRLTMAAFAGAVGGADALVLYPHDFAAGGEHPLGSRLARNAGLVLMEESALGRVIDPAAGAFAMEKLTNQLALQAWDAFTEIERAGGAPAAVESGFVSERIERDRTALRDDLQQKRLRIVGVTDYPAAQPEPTAAAANYKVPAFRLEALA